jgi:predicted membrane protein (TIGR00267 family)
MTFRNWFANPRTRLDVTAGLVDGILTALTLAAGRLLRPSAEVSGSLAFRIGIATGLMTLFVFFVAHYAELRAELSRAERQLNLSSQGRLAAGHLGRRALWDAGIGSAVAAGCGLLGASAPVALCLLFPAFHWISILAAIAMLGILGAILGRSLHGSAVLWSAAIMCGGAALACLGIKLAIVE